MAIFRYKAVNNNGKKVQDLINAFNKRAALEKLKKRGLKNISLYNKTDSLELKILTAINRVTTKDLVAFSRQFSVMISANLPLVKSLKIVAEQTKNVTFKIVISEIAQEVDGGARLSEALAKRPKIFSKFYVNIVRSGETSGKLDEVLTYLADEMERNYDMMSKVKGALIYPAIVFLGLIGIGIFMMVFVIPKLTEMLSSADTELPLATRVVIGTSNFLVGYWWVILLGFVVLIILFKMYGQSDIGRYYIDFLKLKLPIFGKLFHYIYIVHFASSMSTLVSGGVQVNRSLEIVKDVMGNRLYQELIEEASEKVKEGDTISSVFIKSDIMPRMVSQMISVGERTGKIDMVLKKISKFYERELTNLTNNLMTLLEPIIVIIMGIGVGIMVAAIIMPMYNMASSF